MGSIWFGAISIASAPLGCNQMRASSNIVSMSSVPFSPAYNAMCGSQLATSAGRDSLVEMYGGFDTTNENDSLSSSGIVSNPEPSTSWIEAIWTLPASLT